MSDQMTSWLEDVRAFVHDDSDARGKLLGSRHSIYLSEVPDEWWPARKELDERARLLGLRLEDGVLPALDERDPRRSALVEMGEALSELRFATVSIRSDISARTDHYQNVDRVEHVFILESTSGGTVKSACPRCGARSESASALLSHFEIEHPFLRGEKILTDPSEHMIEVDRAVRRCRVALRESKRLFGAHENAYQSDESAKETPENVFRRDGDKWVLAFEGKSARVKNSKGLAYLGELLARPNKHIAAAELIQGVNGTAATLEEDQIEVDLEGDGLSVTLGGASSPIDRQTAAAYKKEMKDLQTKVADAETRGDTKAADEALQELDKWKKELQQAYDYKGRERDPSDPQEQARNAVSRAIGRSKKIIDDEIPLLGKHIRKSVKSSEGFFVYNPERQVDWDL